MSHSDSSLASPPPVSPLRIAVLCGGPSQERGISLNSARSVIDHLANFEADITPFYVDPYLNFYELSRSQIYSNTPSDFDFKLAETRKRLHEEDFAKRLGEFDLIFPAIHGAYGEDGTLQEFLDDFGLPYVGSGAETCRKMFNKDRAAFLLKKEGFPSFPAITLRRGNPYNKESIAAFFKDNNLTRAVIKPSAGGSSIGVFSVRSPEEAFEKLESHIFASSADSIGLLEPFCQGREFTIVLLENDKGQPVALVPTEISMNYADNAIFDFRRKYLPTNMVEYHSPPRFSDAEIATIRERAEKIYSLFGMRDFARLDGWLMHDGTIWFSDFNPISGMEQNSFMFQQGARVGLSHADIIGYVVNNACRRYGLPALTRPAQKTAGAPVRVLFGGGSAERQVSLMSGTNVWLKLQQTPDYAPEPFFMTPTGEVWRIPYMFCLFHTVEEIMLSCAHADGIVSRLESLVPPIRHHLGLSPEIRFDRPHGTSLQNFIDESRAANAFVFLGLHGGIGEDGTIQSLLDAAGVLYNGSGPAASRLCMDKNATGAAITAAGIDKVMTAPKRTCRIPDDFAAFKPADYARFWDELCATLKTSSFIIKPQSDGCSAGVIHIRSADDIEKYVGLLLDKAPYIPSGTFHGQHEIVEMSRSGSGDYLIESFIETDVIRIHHTDLKYQDRSGWIELTVGVLSSAERGEYHTLNPSITVAEGDMLSLEEKFQGGTGVNITPPPENILTAAQVAHLKYALAQVARTLGIDNYARIDLFYNRKTDDIIIIEANTLPGLTPATVLYHQALAETPPLFPSAFLSRLIRMKSGEKGLLPKVA